MAEPRLEPNLSPSVVSILYAQKYHHALQPSLPASLPGIKHISLICSVYLGVCKTNLVNEPRVSITLPHKDILAFN